MNEKLDYLLAAFEYFLNERMSPEEAWTWALEAYVAVYYTEDDRTYLQRASQVVLDYLETPKGGEPQNK